MTGTIITGVHLTGVVLSNSATENPATIAASGTVSNTGNALYGHYGFNWTVSNLGTIIGTGTVGLGIFLPSGGDVTNGGIGSTKALIEGSDQAIEIGYHSAGTVTNLGTIKGIGAASIGIVLSAGSAGSGGAVINGRSGSNEGLITAPNKAVAIYDGTGKVTNYGAIEGGGFGVLFDALPAFGGTVTNMGSIESTRTGGKAISLVSGGSVTNGSDISTNALIKGAYGVEAFYGAGTIGNFGTIEGTGEVTGTDFQAINFLDGGEITNGSSTATKALIEGSGYGVRFFGASSTIANFGTIEATGTNVSASGTGMGLLSGGTVTNGSTGDRKAVISSAQGSAISVGGTTGGSGTVNNFGTILTTGTAATPLAPAIYLGGGGTITNYGLVKGAVPSTGGPQGVITTHNALATIRNFGTILSTHGNNAINLDHGGAIVNGSASDKTALISGLSSGIVGGNSPHTGAAYGVGAAGTIVNYGTIKSTGNGSVISLISGGVVTNHGIIEGTGTGNPGNTGILLAGSAVKVTNSGTIISAGEDGSGVDLHSNGYVSNTGLISAYHIGIYANTTTSTGRVVNLGTIERELSG